MSTKTSEQQIAREMQDRLGCSYGYALNTVRGLKPVAEGLKAKKPGAPFAACLREALESHLRQTRAGT